MLDLEQLAESEELFDGHYKLLYPLNTDGATADIWLAVDTNTVDDEESDNNDEEQGLKVAIKVYRPQNALDIEGVQRFRNEFKVVFNCQHSNLLHPVHFSIYKDTPYLVLPYCKNGSCELLAGQVQDNDAIWKYISVVASGLDYLHSNNPQIIHQDIKPANILIDDKQNYAITDFGISIASDSQRNGKEENIGTLAYMAPERFVEGTVPIPESDIWALGATLYELITGHVPFGENGGNAMPAGKIVLPFPPNISMNIRRLILACLDKNIANRPTAAELVDAARRKVYHFRSRKRIILFTRVVVLSAFAIFLVCYFGIDTKFVQKKTVETLAEAKTIAHKLDSNTIGTESPTQVQGNNMPIEVEKEIRFDGSAYITRLFNKSAYEMTVVLNGEGKRFKAKLDPGEVSSPNFICTSIYYKSSREEGVFWKKENSKNTVAQSSYKGIPIEVEKEIKQNGKAFIVSIRNVSYNSVAVRIFMDGKSILYYLEPGDVVKPYRLSERIAYGDKNGWKILWMMK